MFTLKAYGSPSKRFHLPIPYIRYYKYFFFFSQLINIYKLTIEHFFSTHLH